ncbi:MAG: flagellar assembly protein FliH [Desulfovibrio sp.]|jgi:flagellar biosynthesis/type III secretory pathway protein FliH|nr:flagellar assembly protein FliH [Desulfovibrio sp.]
MASDEARKKWGTVFMGEREAGMAELAAMQEPLLQERQKQQRQRDYLENVRARAEERARGILAAAYAEREKVLENAQQEAEELSFRLRQESETLKTAAEMDRIGTAEERKAAEEFRREAEDIRSAAHSEGFQAGMEHAGAELKEFRAELGAALAVLLRAVEAQRRELNAFWREDIAELVRAAAAAGTGWLLAKEHDAILRALALNSLDMLEDRAVLHLRVHPEDEARIGDLFTAARERIPELKQWAITADAGLEPGDFIAESAHGSAETRRKHFREMVESVLAELTLPAGEDGLDNAPVLGVEGEDMSALVEREVARITALAQPPHSVDSGSESSEMPCPGESGAEEVLEKDVPEAEPAPLPGDSASEGLKPLKTEDSPAVEGQEPLGAEAAPEMDEPELLKMKAVPETEGPLSETKTVAEPAFDGIAPSVPVELSAAPRVSPEAEGIAAKMEPSMAELEDELFSRDAPAVFAEGGFPPGGGDA